MYNDKVIVRCVEKKNTKPLAVVNESSVHQGEGSVEGPSEDEVQLDSSLDDVEDATKLLQSPKKSIDENAEGEDFKCFLFFFCFLIVFLLFR